MNKEEFLDVNREDWWLVDPAAPDQVKQVRDELGAALGYQSEPDWYTKPERLESLWALVENNSELQAEFEAAATDLDKRPVLVEKLTEKTEEANAPEAAEAAEQAASAAPGATASTAPAPPEAPVAPPKKSLFHKAEAETAESESAESTAATGAGVAAGSADTTPLSKPSPFAKKPAESAETATTSPPASGPTAATDGPVEVVHVDVEELKSEVSVLLESSAIDLNKEDVDKLAEDPNFDEHLAEASAALLSDAQGEDDDDEDWDDDLEEEELEPAES
jgi:hypothetical protein